METAVKKENLSEDKAHVKTVEKFNCLDFIKKNCKASVSDICVLLFLFQVSFQIFILLDKTFLKIFHIY